MATKSAGKGWLLWLAAACLWGVSACNDNGSLTPASSGKPYEVLLYGDKEGIVSRVLSSNMPALPQPEPMFDVTAAAGAQPDAVKKLARAIVIVETDSTQYTQTSIHYERNVYASPQIIAYVTTPSGSQLRKSMATGGRQLAALLTSFELNAQAAVLKRKHNPEAEQRIRRMFGIEMCIPADMLSSKAGKDFIWLSNNTASGMQNICIYRGTNRDSIMKANIPGERSGSYMATVRGSTVRQGRTLRGLWETRGDAMGGPFVVKQLTGSPLPPHDTISIEAFVYAPEGNKRNKLRQTEAALYTARLAAAE